WALSEMPPCRAVGFLGRIGHRLLLQVLLAIVPQETTRRESDGWCRRRTSSRSLAQQDRKRLSRSSHRHIPRPCYRGGGCHRASPDTRQDPAWLGDAYLRPVAPFQVDQGFCQGIYLYANRAPVGLDCTIV